MEMLQPMNSSDPPTQSQIGIQTTSELNPRTSELASKPILGANFEAEPKSEPPREPRFVINKTVTKIHQMLIFDILFQSNFCF